MVPGKSVVVAFNKPRHVRIMKELAQSGLFSCMEVFDYPLSKSCGAIEPGTALYNQL
jgi:hypothetical protein